LDSLSSIAQAQYQELDNLLQDANEKLVDSYVHESWTKVKVQAVDSFRVGNYAAAIELYTRCLDEFKVPKTERLRITQFRGNANYRAGNLKLAAEDLNEVIDALEGNDLSQDQKTIRNDALFTMLLVHLSEDRTDKALEVSKTLLDKDLPTFELINSSVPASFRSNSKFQEYKKQANKLRSSASR
jgi:tetratricopeptide (TPR) repeat protein